MNPTDLEEIYASLAQKIDEVGETQCPVFLAKLVLLLAEKTASVIEFQQLVDDAAATIDR